MKRATSLAGHQDLAYRSRFYPTSVQAAMLAQVFGCLRVVWNTCLRLRAQDWVLYRKNLNYDGMNDVLTMMRHDKERPWLQEVSIVPLQQALRHLDRACVVFVRRQHDGSHSPAVSMKRDISSCLDGILVRWAGRMSKRYVRNAHKKSQIFFWDFFLHSPARLALDFWCP